MQLGDAAQEFEYGTYSGNRSLVNTPLMRPMNGGIEGRQPSPQQGTLMHHGTSPKDSLGCTVMIDGGHFETQRKHLAGVGKSGMHQLPAEQRGADAATLEREIALEKQKARPDRAKVSRLESLLEMRYAEPAHTATTAGEKAVAQRQTDTAAGRKGKRSGQGIAEVITAPNYKAFLSMVLRDPDMTLRYVTVERSKVEAFGGRVQTPEVI